MEESNAMYMSVRNNISSFLGAWGKIFLVTLFFVSAASALFFLDMFRGYEAEVRILVVGRSAAVDPEQAAANLAALVGTLPFHDRVVADDLLGDPLEGYPQADRRARWNDMVRAKRESGNSVISITAAGEDPEEARQLAARVAKTLFGVAGVYYDVKSGIDMRAIDGPIAETVISRPFAYAGTTLLSAFLATVAFFGILVALPAAFGRNRESHAAEPAYDAAHRAVSEYGVGDAVPYIDPRKFIPVRPSSLPFENAYPETHAAQAPSVKAAAPSNLPIADDALDLPVSDEPLPFMFEEAEPSEYPSDDLPFRGEHEVDEEAASENALMGGEEFHAHEAEERGEPTVEEYKRRLNELLQGGK